MSGDAIKTVNIQAYVQENGIIRLAGSGSYIARLDDEIPFERLIEVSAKPLMNEQIEKAFTYHAPKPGQPEKYTAIREKAKELAYLIDAHCPNSREKSLAMTKLEEAVFWANASIARNE